MRVIEFIGYTACFCAGWIIGNLIFGDVWYDGVWPLMCGLIFGTFLPFKKN